MVALRLSNLVVQSAAHTNAGMHVSRARCAERIPAEYGGGVSGHVCMRRAHPRRLRRGREWARMCPARECAERTPAGYGGGVSGHACVPLAT